MKVMSKLMVSALHVKMKIVLIAGINIQILVLYAKKGIPMIAGTVLVSI